MSSPRRTRSRTQPSTPPGNTRGQAQTPSTSHRHNENSNPEPDSPGSSLEYKIPEDEPSTSFSPSKARAQAKATHQLTVLKTWLNDILAAQDPDSNPRNTTAGHKSALHPLITRWEHEHANLMQTNPALGSDTFSVLRDLMHANQAADHHRQVLQEARREALDSYGAQASSPPPPDAGASDLQTSRGREILTGLEDALDPRARASLASLADVAVSLGLDIAGAPGQGIIQRFSAAVMVHADAVLDLRADIASLEALREELEMQVSWACEQMADLEEIRGGEKQDAEKLQAQTSQWQREMKQIALKMAEYQDRIATLSRTRPVGDVLVDDVVEMLDKVQLRKDVVRALEDRLSVFHGLPADLDASRLEVKRARNELAELQRRRETLFEKMVD